MEPWLKISLILCMFGFLKGLRPSEYFIVEFYLHPPMNFTSEQVTREFFPCAIYSHMITQVFVFLVTDYLRYKPMILLHSISGMVVFTILITCRKVFQIKIAESTYGFFGSSEIAYYTYIYAKVEKKHYQEVTSQTRAALLLGTATSGCLAQILISNKLLQYYHLNYFNVAGLALATLWALFLPPVKQSIYSRRQNETATSMAAPKAPKSQTQAFGDFMDEPESNPETNKERDVPIRRLMMNDLKHAFTNAYLIKWIVWSVFATGAYFQTITFIQLLWDEVARKEGQLKEEMWNGAISSVYTLLGALSTFLTGKLKQRWHKIGDYVLAVNTMIMAALLYIMAHTDKLIVTYIMYIGLNIMYQCTITIVNSEIAKNLKENCFGLIFGVLEFFSLVLQSILTFTIVNGLQLRAKQQFNVCSGYFMVLGSLYVIISLFTIVRKCSNRY